MEIPSFKMSKLLFSEKDFEWFCRNCLEVDPDDILKYHPSFILPDYTPAMVKIWENKDSYDGPIPYLRALLETL